MPASQPATGNARSAATPDGDAFASLLEAERATTEAPVVPGALATPQPMSAPAQASQLQTLASADPAVASNTAAATPTDGSAQPATSATLIEGAAAVLLTPGTTMSASVTVATPQASAEAVTAAAGLQTTGAVTGTDTDTDPEGPEAGGPVVAELATIAVTPGATAASGAIVVAPPGISQDAQAATVGASAVAQPSDTAPDIAPASDTAADAAETIPANPGGRSSSAQTPNQPAAATAAAAAQPAATAADTTSAKPDFASLLASPSTQAQDAPSQAGGQPSEASRPGSLPPTLQSAPAATIQVYNRIIERADGRAQRFEIRLDPAELGRVDVRIEIGADRKVHAVLAAHDSAALSDLMRGQRALERALADAGIDLANNGVRFELARDTSGGTAGQQRDSDGRPAQPDVWRRFDTVTMPATSEAAAAVQPSWRPQRLDLVA